MPNPNPKPKQVKITLMMPVDEHRRIAAYMKARKEPFSAFYRDAALGKLRGVEAAAQARGLSTDEWAAKRVARIAD